MAPIKAEIVVQTPQPQIVSTNEGAIVLLQETFKNTPVMVEIAKCESGLNQWDQNGQVLRGLVNPNDRGMFQINEDYHLEASKKLGYDIYSAEGNIAYAKMLYAQEGTRPWRSSQQCWQ